MENKHETLIRNLSRRNKIDVHDQHLILSKFKLIEVGKQAHLLKGDSTCKSIYYVYSGALRSYVVTDDGKEKVIMFALRDWWITDIDSFTNKQPSVIYIEALEDCVLYELNIENFEILIHTCPVFESVFRNMMQYAYIREQNRALELIMNDSYTRYTKLVTRYPELEQSVSQKHMASYLGITPEFLSNLKKKSLLEKRS